MDEVINNDAIEGIKERYQVIADKNLHITQNYMLWGRSGGRTIHHLDFPPSLGAAASDLAAAADIIISLCNHCVYKDEEVKKVEADIEHFKKTSKDAEKRLMKRLANAGSE